MFNIKIISILTIFVFLFVGCEDPTKVEDSNSATKKNTLNDSSLGNETGFIQDYFYDFDEEIDAQFLYYSLPYYDGMVSNTMQSPGSIDLDRDTLNFKTFPDYLLDLTADFINIDPRLYRLNEANTSENNWCENLLIEYDGNCPNSVDFNKDGKKTSTGIHRDKKVKKDTTFIITWEDIDSLKWLSDKNRYDMIFKNPTRSDTFKVSYNDLQEPDYYDSLIYIGVIDTMRFTIDNLLFVDRSEWERFDKTYKKSEYSIKLEHSFEYEKVLISEDSLMFRVNSDCNQNGVVDDAEKYWDWGPDWCPDSLETGEGFCRAQDNDDKPCHCLGNWIIELVDEVNPNWQEAVNNELHLDPDWMYSDNWRNLDPNGDRWRDCGCDRLCYSDDEWPGADPGESEGNKIVDCDEKFEGNAQYDYDVEKSSGEYFEDVGNEIIDDAEYCNGNIENFDCKGTFEDKNCNNKWDAEETEETKFSGNGLRDAAEKWRDDNGDGAVQANEIYFISEKMEVYLVNYPENTTPIPLNGVTSADTIRLKYLTGENAFYITFDSLITIQNIQKTLSASFRPIDSVRTIYTNKIIESSLDGENSDYFITKTTWTEDVFDENEIKISDYGYDYHIFNTGRSNGKIVKMIHPEYFKHYGYATDLKTFDEGFWVDPIIKEEVYIYTYNNFLRDGEYNFTVDTMFTDIGNYYVTDEYEVAFDSAVPISIRRILYDESLLTNTGLILCFADTSLSVSQKEDCPMDSLIENTYKITRTKTFIMLGNGVEFGFRNTFWLGHDDVNDKPMGIIKDKIEYRWTEAPWDVDGSGWKEYSRLELRSLRFPKTSLPRNLLHPIHRISINQIGKDQQFEFDPFQLNSTFGLHRIRKYYGE